MIYQTMLLHEDAILPPDPPIRKRPQVGEWIVWIHPRVYVVNIFPNRTIFVDCREWICYDVRKWPEERLAITLLARQGFITQKTIADAFGVSVRSIHDWLKIYDKYGAPGLLLPGISSLKEEESAETDVQNPADGPNNPSLPTVSQVSLPDLSEPVGPTADAPSTPPPPPPILEDNNVPEPNSDSPICGFSIYSRYVGLLLGAPWYHEIMDPVLNYLRSQTVINPNPYRTYGTDDLINALTFFVLGGMTCPEQIKASFPHEFGIILGKSRGPCCDTIRRNLPSLGDEKLLDLAEEQVLANFIACGYVQLGLIHLDGHFVPYHGIHEVSSGYWPQRRGPHQGHEQFWATDLRGRPLFCFLDQAFASFPAIIPRMVKHIQQHLQRTGVDHPLIVCFDRGAYAAELFAILDEMNVGWITWKKYKTEYNEEFFQHRIDLLASDGHIFTSYFNCTEVSITGYRDDVYAMALCDPTTKRQATLITNLNRLFPESADPILLLSSLKSRWNEENFFKMAVVHENIDQLMGYDISPMADDEYLIVNPEWESTARKLYSVKQELAVVNAQISGLPDRYAQLNRKPSYERWLDGKQNRLLFTRRDELEREQAELEEKLSSLKKVISYQELKGHPIDMFRFHRHRMVLLIKMVSYHILQQLRDCAHTYFKDYRELGKFIQVLLTAGGTYTYGAECDTICLNAHTVPRYREAMAAVLAAINAREPRSLDDRSQPLRFTLAEAATGK